MTAKMFLKKLDKNKLVIEKYGLFFYFLATDVLNISRMEKVCEDMGYRTVRKKVDPYSCKSELYFKNKLIGDILPSVGFPNIIIYGSKKHAIKIAESDIVIPPIKGVHRVLEWHDVEDKLHILANAIAIHFIPAEITDEIMHDFLTKYKLIDKVEEFKSHENKF